jgi:hypothetical protein
MDIEVEIRELKRRVSDLESAYDVLTGQVRHLRPDLVKFRDETAHRLDRFDRLLDRVGNTVDGFGARIGGIELQVWSLRDDLPAMIAGAVRQGNDRSS